MSAVSGDEQLQQTAGGEPTTQEIPNTILCRAIVLHKHDDEEMRRYIEKVTSGKIISIEYMDEKRKAIRNYILTTAGITSLIIFGTLFIGDIILQTHEGKKFNLELLTSVWLTPTLAAFLAGAIEAGFIWREQN